MGISLKTDYGLIYFIVSVMLAGLIAYYYYKKTNLDGLKKKLFTALRFLSTLFILFLFSSPVISFVKKILQDPVSIFLIDDSQSLLLDNREAKLKELLVNKIGNSDPGNSENLYFLYSNNLKSEIDKNDFDKISYEGIDNFETDLTNTLYSLQDKLAEKNISQVTIISDGIINEGGNPLTAAKLLNTPVNYIVTGDTVQNKDLVLRNIFYNKTAFIESNVPVNLEINSFNYNAAVKVNLYEDEKLIQTKELAVNENQNSYDLNMNVISNEEKIARYKVEIEGMPDEITLKNNYQEFFIKFVNNKFKILVMAGGPGADFAFISEEIKKVKNFEATFRTQKSASEYYEGTMPDLSGFDSYVFIGYPTAITNQNILSEIKYNLEKNNSSLIFFASKNTDYGKLSILQERLPFRASLFSENESETGIKSVSSLESDVFKNTALISSVNSFPNIFKTATNFTGNASAEAFLLMTQNSEPAFLIQNTEKNKSAAFLAYGLYKWSLNNQKNNAEEALSYILTSSVVAVTNKEAKKTFTIETTKPVYSKFEPVKFVSHITNYELQGGEQIKVRISGVGFNGTLDLTKKDNKYYEGEIKIPVDGTYEYTGELMSKNNLVESIQNKFAVGENNFEYKLTRADNSILENMSNETGGRNFTNLETTDIKNELKNINEKSISEIKSRRNFELNINPYYLGIVIFLLCLEWFLRKRNNLP